MTGTRILAIYAAVVTGLLAVAVASRTDWILDTARWAALNCGAELRPHWSVGWELHTRGADDYHGVGGPLWCSDIGEPHELMEAIIAAAQALGVPRNDDFNGARQEGVGYYQLFTRRGWRCSAATGYLRPAEKRPNLRVETNAHATGVLFEGGFKVPALSPAGRLAAVAILGLVGAWLARGRR